MTVCGMHWKLCSEARVGQLATACVDIAVGVCVAAGIVLAREGGALGKMMPVFNIFAGGPLGSGRQWCSWIHRQVSSYRPGFPKMQAGDLAALRDQTHQHSNC